MSAPAPLPPVPATFPSPFARGPPVVAPPAPKTSAAVPVIIVLGTLLVIGFGLVMAVLNAVRADATRSSMPGSVAVGAAAAGDAPRAWASRFRQALLSGQGAVPNVCGVARWVDGTTRLVALDGATGKLLWQQPGDGLPDVYADGRDVLMTYGHDKKVQRHDAKTGALMWSIQVADYVGDITFGADCASLGLGQPLGIDTQTGALKTCKPSELPQAGSVRDKPRDLQLKRGDIELLGSVQLDNKPINPEPARFVVTAARAGHQLWKALPTELEPTWTIEGFTRSMALTPSGVFLFGRTPSDHHARWLLLDVGTGRSVYSRTTTTRVDDEAWVTPAGPEVLVMHDLRLEAYDAATGALLWFVGERSN